MENFNTDHGRNQSLLTVLETMSSETGIMFSGGDKLKAAAASDSSSSVLLLRPPPGSEIPRSASVNSAVPRPRPQVHTQIHVVAVSIMQNLTNSPQIVMYLTRR